MTRAARTLVLASTSPFRRELLERLGLPFSTCAPDVDETPRPGESPAAMVARLARAKAEAVRDRFPGALIIGSDQCAELDGKILGKPGNHERAVAQLSAASGRSVAFHTGLCLLDAESGERQEAVEPFRVHFRTLGREEIEDYVHREQPYGCAGSFKSEGLGIALFERLEGDDPTALIGLPLIRLCRMLTRTGIPVLSRPAAE
ncbi:Maf family protein [Ectothiorhodospira shaposhnikovii]|uniref:Maf family protein n=1 Tax=Ectothiorhodospira shaposhnikovii TaxID=1054 RepID=UPI0039A37A12